MGSELGIKPQAEEQFTDVHELPPPDAYDPVIEAYKKDVDRTLLRENLKLSVEDRLSKFANFMRFLNDVREAGRKMRER